MFNASTINDQGKDNGVWTDFGGGEFLIASTNSMAFQREFSRLQQPFAKKIDKGTLDPKIQTEILCKAMAHGLLLDWKNVGDGKNIIEYSFENAVRVLIANPDLREFIQDFSMNLENYRKEEMKEEGEF